MLQYYIYSYVLILFVIVIVWIFLRSIQSNLWKNLYNRFKHLHFISSAPVQVNAIFGQNKVFETANDIPSNVLKEKQEINGRIVSISDGDTYRLRHIPYRSPIAGLFSGDTEKFNGPLKFHTIIVRIYAVDTPEIAKFGTLYYYCFLNTFYAFLY